MPLTIFVVRFGVRSMEKRRAPQSKRIIIASLNWTYLNNKHRNISACDLIIECVRLFGMVSGERARPADVYSVTFDMRNGPGSIFEQMSRNIFEITLFIRQRPYWSELVCFSSIGLFDFNRNCIGKLRYRWSIYATLIIIEVLKYVKSGGFPYRPIPKRKWTYWIHTKQYSPTIKLHLPSTQRRYKPPQSLNQSINQPINQQLSGHKWGVGRSFFCPSTVGVVVPPTILIALALER